MASRVKTLEYAFQTHNAELADTTRLDFGVITLYIPTNDTRTFLSVMLMVGCRDTVTTAASATAPTLGIKLGDTASDDAVLGNPPANSGESQFFMFQRDVTAYFETNFGVGTSQTCIAAFQITGITSINISAKLIITYQYEEPETTDVKTVRIPLESGTGSLTATLAEIGTNQVPALDTFLPETSKVYRNIFFELIYNESTTGPTNDSQLGMQLDSATEHLTGIHESAMASSCAGVYHWVNDSMTTNAVHAFKLRSSTITAASKFYHVAIILYVTYEYAVSSTTVINSLVLGLPHITLPGATTDADFVQQAVDLYIEEPATITLKQSGALVIYSGTTAAPFSIGLGAQDFRDYTDLGVVNAGCAALTHRVDSGGAMGAAFSLARGQNTLAWKMYMDTAQLTPAGFSCTLYLNYTSGKAASEGQHNHTTFWSIQNTIASAAYAAIAADQWVTIPEATWFQNNLAVYLNCYYSIRGTGPYGMFGFEVEKAAEELDGVGFHMAFRGLFSTDGEAGWYPMGSSLAAGDWDRWASDPEVRMDVEGSRRARIYTDPNSTLGCYMTLTHHSITTAFAGTISGSADGTVNVYLHRKDTGGLLGTTTRVGDGGYSITWYDDTITKFVDAREDATHLGRSDDGTGA